MDESKVKALAEEIMALPDPERQQLAQEALPVLLTTHAGLAGIDQALQALKCPSRRCPRQCPAAGEDRGPTARLRCERLAVGDHRQEVSCREGRQVDPRTTSRGGGGAATCALAVRAFNRRMSPAAGAQGGSRNQRSPSARRRLCRGR